MHRRQAAKHGESSYFVRLPECCANIFEGWPAAAPILVCMCLLCKKIAANWRPPGPECDLLPSIMTAVDHALTCRVKRAQLCEMNAAAFMSGSACGAAGSRNGLLPSSRRLRARAFGRGHKFGAHARVAGEHALDNRQQI